MRKDSILQLILSLVLLVAGGAYGQEAVKAPTPTAPASVPAAASAAPTVPVASPIPTVDIPAGTATAPAATPAMTAPATPAQSAPAEGKLIAGTETKPEVASETKTGTTAPATSADGKSVTPADALPTTAEKPADGGKKAKTDSSKSMMESLSQWLAPSGIGSSTQLLILLSVLSLAPAIVMMTTSFVRVTVVLGILRHGFGTQGLPSTQVLTALALFITFFVMFPVWTDVYSNALVPYQNEEIDGLEAWNRGIQPVRQFMLAQLEQTGNTDEIWLFWRNSSTPPDESKSTQYTGADVPLHVLVPAFMLGELKTAFLIGVQLLLPMLVIDLLVSAILVSMGMYMLPPSMISLPFKLLLFVMVDGWRLVVEMLLHSFGS